MTRALRTAVIGARIGQLHASALARLPHTELRWVCDTNADLARQVASANGCTRVTTQFEETLADPDVDLVTIAVPHHLHFDFIRKALEAGKHVAVEKPICNTLDEVDRIIALRRTHPQRIGVIFQNRFSPAARSFMDSVRGGEIGEVRLACLSLKWHRAAGYFATAPWRSKWSTAGGGVLTTQGIHYLDLLQAAVGLPARVTAHIATLAHDIEVEDAAVVMGTFPNGGLFSLAATTACYPEEPAYVQIIGSKGSVCLSECRGQMTVAMTVAPDVPKRAPLLRSLGDIDDMEPQNSTVPIQASDEGHKDFFEAFSRAILTGRTFEMDEVEARKTSVLLDAIYRSAYEKSEIRLGEKRA